MSAKIVEGNLAKVRVDCGGDEIFMLVVVEQVFYYAEKIVAYRVKEPVFNQIFEVQPDNIFPLN